jgi:6-phosphofructokinase
VPKTIDNDVGDSEFKLIDHTPGYGSVARYWALTVQNVTRHQRNDRLIAIERHGIERKEKQFVDD